MNDKIKGYFEMLSYEPNIDNIFTQATRIVKVYEKATNNSNELDIYWLDNVIRYANEEYLTVLPDRLIINDNMTKIFNKISYTLHDGEEMNFFGFNEKDHNRILNKLKLISKLVVINPDYTIQKVSPFGTFIDIMKTVNEKENILMTDIENIAFQLYEKSTNHTIYKKYINIFKMRYGNFIEYIVNNIMLKATTRHSSIDDSIYKLAIWFMIDSSL